MLLAVPTAVVATALFGAPSFAAVPATTTVAPMPGHGAPATTQGIIMRDGGVCDPIRHMGC